MLDVRTALTVAALAFSNLTTTTGTTGTIGTTGTTGTNIPPINWNQYGFALFYPLTPTPAQITAWSTGIFEGGYIPPSPYSCRPDPPHFFSEPTFACDNSELPTQTPEGIHAYGAPFPRCLSLNFAFEKLQWATWTHSCWASPVPVPAPDTPDGHREAAFKSAALAFRALVFHQHDAHVLTLNKQIERLFNAKEADVGVLIVDRDLRLAEIDAWGRRELAKLPGRGAKHGIRAKRLWKRVRAKKDFLRKEAESTMVERERLFWKKSFPLRMKIVELDHLVGPYFERWMGGGTQEGWDWAGMGQPVPAWPDALVVPLG